MPLNKRKTSRRGRGSTAVVGRMVAAEHIANPMPMPFNSSLTLTKKFRFSNGANAGIYTITPAKLGALIVMGTVTNTTAVQFFDAVKLLSVEVWAASNSTTVPQTIGINYAGSIAGISGSQYSRSDTSMGMTRNAHVKLAPPALSQAAQWQPCDTTGGGIATNTLFKVSLPNYSIIDVTIDASVPAVARASANTVTLTTSILGVIYYLALDNSAGGTGSGSSDLIPADTSLPTTS